VTNAPPYNQRVTDLPTRCARPTLGPRNASTYTVLGFTGYGLASVVVALITWAWGLPLLDRLIAMLAPPITFLAVVKGTKRVTGKERIVLYQTALAGVVVVTVISAVVDAHTARLVDATTIGIGVFLVFGRLGCFAVACCHGRPARFGVVYGEEHARLGFWRRWVGRRLWPVQLVESAVSCALCVIALVVGWNHPGVPATIYGVGYGVARFALELRRGDAARPHKLGVSEAQWTATATLVVIAIVRPGAATLAAAATLVVALAVLVRRTKQRELTLAPHLREIDRACKALLASPAESRRETSLGIGISCHTLPDGRRDWVLSGNHSAWSMTIARRIAGELWNGSEFVAGRIEGVAHIIEAPRESREIANVLGSADG